MCAAPSSFEFFSVGSYDRSVSQNFIPASAVSSSGVPNDGGSIGLVLRSTEDSTNRLTARVSFTKFPVVGLAGVGIILDIGPGDRKERTMHVFLPHARYPEWIDLLSGPHRTSLFYTMSGDSNLVFNVSLTTESDPLATFGPFASEEEMTDLPDEIKRLLRGTEQRAKA
jgi:hypothetical protein